MPGLFVQETFFRPEGECARKTGAIPASIHNALQLLLNQAGGTSVFVPIRAMQYLAVVERTEVIFVDSLGGYAHQDGVGGRLIRIAWRPMLGRESLSAPVPCEMVYYFRDMDGVQSRLMAEIGAVLKRMLDRSHHPQGGGAQGRILTFRRDVSR